jgi:hypothetical protein
MTTSAGRRSRRGSLQAVLDFCVPAALAIALGVVYLVDRSLDDGNNSQELEVLKIEKDPSGQSGPARRLNLGVTPVQPEFDDMGRLLESLGEGYRYATFALDDLRHFDRIAEYDIIFLTCSGVPRTWLDERIGEGMRAGTEVFTPKVEVFREVEEALEQFLKQGKTLYVSDLHYDLVAGAVPEFADPRAAGRGRVQDVTAEIVDPGLRELLGPELELRFDQPGWRPAAFRGEEVVEYMRGTFETEEGRQQTAPLLVKIPVDDGTVIFTSFHNEKQNSEAELKLLRYLVFAAVTAEVDTMVNKQMVSGGFSPAKKNLFSASSGEQSVTGTYDCKEQADLQFVLGFQARQGARLKLTVTGPGNTKEEKEGSSTVTIDVPGAAVGKWQYKVTALKVPNENFPFTVTVGTK